MGIIGWIVLGLIAGAIAKAIMPGKDPGGIIITMLLGVAGALLGGFIGSRIFGVGLREFWSIQTWLVAIIGSIVVLAIYRVVVGRRAVRS
ncbi:MAG: GlsB/YeaQ/YmgE family stress response membrane protein [Pseudonocardiales bacterium]